MTKTSTDIRITKICVITQAVVILYELLKDSNDHTDWYLIAATLVVMLFQLLAIRFLKKHKPQLDALSSKQKESHHELQNPD
jgi:heme O synthase-like polyprenyltransferase